MGPDDVIVAVVPIEDTPGSWRAFKLPEPVRGTFRQVRRTFCRLLLAFYTDEQIEAAQAMYERGEIPFEF